MWGKGIAGKGIAGKGISGWEIPCYGLGRTRQSARGRGSTAPAWGNAPQRPHRWKALPRIVLSDSSARNSFALLRRARTNSTEHDRGRSSSPPRRARWGRVFLSAPMIRQASEQTTSFECSAVGAWLSIGDQAPTPWVPGESTTAAAIPSFRRRPQRSDSSTRRRPRPTAAGPAPPSATHRR